MVRSDLCDCSNAYIVTKGTIDLLAAAVNENDKTQKNVAFKNNALFRSIISKINSTFIDSAEVLDIVMSIYNLLEYSQDYSMTSGKLWIYHDRNKIDNVDDNALDGNSFNYKTKLIEKHQKSHHDNHSQIQINMEINHHDQKITSTTFEVEVTVPLRCISNF